MIYISDNYHIIVLLETRKKQQQVPVTNLLSEKTIQIFVQNMCDKPWTIQFVWFVLYF